MRIAIVGWGLEGQSAYRYFGPKHQYLIANEHRREDFPPESDGIKLQFLAGDQPPGMTGTVEDLSYLEGLGEYDKIIYSVVAYKNLQKVYGTDAAFWDKATTIQHIFFENCPSSQIIGVTGTKGKGTTSTLVAKLLEAQGLKVHFGGNVGRPLLDFIGEVKRQDWVVLELSNFQLHNFPYSPHIGVCLMITEEHQDWHSDMAEYLAAKANIFKHQTPSDIAIYFANDKKSKQVADSSPGKKVPYYAKPGAYVRDDGMIVIGKDEQEIASKSEVKLIGEHNLQNICAALTTVYEAVGSLDKAKAVLHSFSGLEHRLELVRTLQDVKYYDDSFATTPGSAIVAIKAFSQPKVLILGGSDKGLSFEELADIVTKSNVRKAILIGQTASALEGLLKRRGFTDYITGLKTMPKIVEAAHNAAHPGDVVLLSPACASFGLFKDYKDRGNQFKAAVKEL